MATWVDGVRAAQHLIDGVEDCLQGYGYYFHVTLYPFRTNGGRSNGVSAVFEYNYPNDKDKPRKYVCVSVYEHWNTDNLCLKVDQWVPTNILTTEGHDEPNAEFRCDSMQVQTVAYAIQSFLLQFFDLEYPKEWNVPIGFRGTGTFDDADRMDCADDIMMPTIVDWCDPPEEREKMAEFIHDEKEWYQAWLDTPFGNPGGRTAEEAATKPGNAVKSIETEQENGGSPKYHGVLVKYGIMCVVRGHGSPVSPKFVWCGSQSEYASTWVVD